MIASASMLNGDPGRGFWPDGMRIVALLIRELRVVSRSPAGYWLRVLGAGVVFYALATVQNQLPSNVRASGQGIFRGLNWLLAGFIWIVAPILTSDCISREKREGTLPLLFLTNLSSVELVLAKSLVHFTRAGMLLAAAMPVLVIPLLFGGVTAAEVLRAVLLHAAALMLALTAGLMASVLTRHWVASRLLAMAFTVLGSLLFLTTHIGTRVWLIWSSRPVRAGSLTPWQMARFELYTLFSRLTDGASFWADRSGTGAGWGIVGLAVVVLGVSAVMCAAGILCASRIVARVWREEPATGTGKENSAERGFWRIRNPWAKRFGRGRVQERDPMVWVHASGVGARLERGAWVLGAVVAIVLTESWGIDWAYIFVVGFFLLVAAVVSCSSFARELESGAMELLLVSPLSPRAILWGRFRAILWRFYPAWILMVFGLPAYSIATSPGLLVDYGALAVHGFVVPVVALVAMVGVGMALSVSGFPPAGALLLSLLIVLGLPFPMLKSLMNGGGASGVSVLFIGIQAFNFWRAWVYAERQLEQRRYLP